MKVMLEHAGRTHDLENTADKKKGRGILIFKATAVPRF
jgi:hypothetical protein